MISTLFRIVFISLVLSASGAANAALIKVEDWHLTTDNNGGLRQLTEYPDIYLAVAKSTIFSFNDIYEMMDGFRQITTAEAITLFPGNQFSINRQFSYYNHGGWRGYQWEGVNRYVFAYADSALTGHYKHAGNYETHNNTAGFQNLATNYFAGFVLIRTESIPAPSSLAIFALGVMGLAARRFKKRHN